MKRVLGVSSALLTMLLATPAFAGLAISTGGNAVLVAPPADSSPGAFENNLYTVWNESSGTIGSDVAVDYNGAATAGFIAGNQAFSGTTLTAGTAYGATMVQLDPLNDAIQHHSGEASITFSTKIIGIALRGTSLDATDTYGAAGTTYPTGYNPAAPDTRGIDFRSNDKFSVSADGKTLTLRLTANFNGFDQLRVFTAAAVPEPASLVVWTLLGAVVAGGSYWRRRTPPAV